VRIYDAADGSLQNTVSHGSAVLDAAFQDASAIFSCGLDNAVRRLDIATGAAQLVGSHDAAVRCIEWIAEKGFVASSGWDKTLKVWDPRSGNGGAPVAVLDLPGKAYSMSASADRLVVATSERRVLVYNMRTLGPGSEPEQIRDSPLKHQTRCLRCYPTGTGFAISSIEGRVAMEYFEQTEESKARQYAFKCHRRVEGGKDVIFPVNALAFNTKYGTFATGGCDGVASVWDGENKKRLQQIAGYPTSIASLAFSSDATLLAVAASYTYERGEVEHPADAIYVRQMTEGEVRPRQRQ